MMDGKDWHRIVFRVRSIPNRVSDPTEAIKLLSSALKVAADSIVIYSLAKTSNVWEVPPSKVATIQLKSTPSCIINGPNDDEWEVAIPKGSHDDVLLLDTHFKGMTALNDADPAKYGTE